MRSKSSIVSVITSFYNDGIYIEECVRSVANSDYANIEHIIIDDGSTDEASISTLKEIEAKYHVKVLRQSNQGVCAARNTAIRASKGRYILPLDADDKISERYISLAAEWLDMNEAVRLVATPYQYFGRRHSVCPLRPFSMEILLGHNLWVNCSMYRREDFDLLGGYGEYMKKGLEDWEFWIRLMKGGGEVAYLNDVNFFYRIKPNKLSRNASLSTDDDLELYRDIWDNNRDAFANYFPNPSYNFHSSRQKKSALSRLWKHIKTICR